MPRTQDLQGIENFGQTNTTMHSSQNQPQNRHTMPGTFETSAGPQRYEPTVRAAGDNRVQGPEHRNRGDTGTHCPTDIYAEHGGQLGTAGQGQGSQFTSTPPNTGTGTRFDGPGGQSTQTFGQVEAVPGGPLAPPPAVPQPGAQYAAAKPSTGDKLMGNAEKLAGKVSGNERMVERGQARKTGNLNQNGL